MATSRLSLKISAPIVLVSAVAMGLIVLLNVVKLERTLNEVEESRLRFSINELRAELESGLDRGLPIKALALAQAALDAETRRDPGIVSISIVEPNGAAVFNSGERKTRSALWLGANSKRDWQSRSDGVLTMGAKLTNNFGVPVGALVLRYTDRNDHAVVGVIARELALAVLCAIVVTGLCLVFGVALLMRRSERMLDAVAASLGRPLPDSELEPRAAALVTQLNRAVKTATSDLTVARGMLTPRELAHGFAEVAHAGAPVGHLE